MIAPEWLSILESQLRDNPKSTTYALSTITPDGKPHVRHVIHRGITPASLLLLTTDIRMQKPIDLSSHPSIELAWWFESPNVQFRISGSAIHFPPLDSSSRLTIQSKMKELGLGNGESGGGKKEEEGDIEWWEIERKKIFKKGMSGHLRASFARPSAPGTLLNQVGSKPEDWPETIPAESDDPEIKKQIEFALSNFGLIAIKPQTFEYLELKAIPNRRTVWTTLDGGSTWKKESVVP